MTTDAPDNALAVARQALAAQPFTRLLGTELTAWSVDEVALRLAVQPAFFNTTAA